jgi:hypothetical protein
VPYIVSFLQAYSFTGVRGYVWADQQSSPSYTPALAWQFNSANIAPNAIVRTGQGRYVVTMPDLGGEGGNAQVTSYGDAPRICRAVAWGPSSGDEVIRVRCRNKTGALVDNRFVLSYVRGEGLKGLGGPVWAYLLANRSTDPSYIPIATFRDADPNGTPRIKRTGEGSYRVKLPSMPLGGAAQLTALGKGSTRCNVSAIRKSGAPQRIGVRCFDANGTDPADSRFSLSYEK